MSKAKPKADEPTFPSVCHCCGDDVAAIYNGLNTCQDCYNELAKGAIPLLSHHFSGSRDNVKDEDAASAWQENAIKDMESQQ